MLNISVVRDIGVSNYSNIIRQCQQMYLIYKIQHRNGNYYIGRHKTDNPNDDYIGSGTWSKSIKNPANVSKVILEVCEDESQYIEREQYHIDQHYGKPGCMNKSNKATGFPCGSAHHMNKPANRRKHSLRQKARTDHPFLTPENRERMRTNNPGSFPENAANASKRLLKNNPMYDPEALAKISGDNHWTKNNAHLKTCEHCGIANISKSNYTRWHGPKCKSLT